MAETQTYNGWVYTRAAPGQPWRKASPAGGSVAPNPIKVEDARVGINKTVADTRGSVVDTRRTEALLPHEVRKAQADAARAEADATAAQTASQAPQLTPAIRQQALTDYQSAVDLAPIVNELEQNFNAGPGATKGFWDFGSIIDRLPLPQNEKFDSSANKLRGFVKKAQGFTGGEGNTAAEMAMNVGAFIPSSKDYDSTTRQNLGSLRGEQRRGLRTALQVLGGIPDSNGRVTPIPTGYRVGQYPDLDLELGKNISIVPPEKRQAFILDAKNRFEQAQAARKNPKRGMFGSKPATGGRRSAEPGVVDFNDLP